MIDLDEVEKIGEIFINGFIKPNYERYGKRESDWRDGLKLFLSGGAFERQGRSPNYSPVAVNAINTLCIDHRFRR